VSERQHYQPLAYPRNAGESLARVSYHAGGPLVLKQPIHSADKVSLQIRCRMSRMVLPLQESASAKHHISTWFHPSYVVQLGLKMRADTQ
jgi:hypothetical protein